MQKKKEWYEQKTKNVTKLKMKEKWNETEVHFVNEKS